MHYDNIHTYGAEEKEKGREGRRKRRKVRKRREERRGGKGMREEGKQRGRRGREQERQVLNTGHWLSGIDSVRKNVNQQKCGKESVLTMKASLSNNVCSSPFS